MTTVDVPSPEVEYLWAKLQAWNRKHDEDSKFLFISWESNDHQMQNPPTFQTLTWTMYQWQLLDPELELLLQKQGAQVAEQSQSSEAPLPLEYVDRLNWNMYAKFPRRF